MSGSIPASVACFLVPACSWTGRSLQEIAVSTTETPFTMSREAVGAIADKLFDPEDDDGRSELMNFFGGQQVLFLLIQLESGLTRDDALEFLMKPSGSCSCQAFRGSPYDDLALPVSEEALYEVVMADIIAFQSGAKRG